MCSKNFLRNGGTEINFSTTSDHSVLFVQEFLANNGMTVAPQIEHPVSFSCFEIQVCIEVKEIS
jgi:hypothetical protein